MPSKTFKAEIRNVKTGKPYGDPQAVITLSVTDLEVIAYLSLVSLQEDSIIDMSYHLKNNK